MAPYQPTKFAKKNRSPITTFKRSPLLYRTQRGPARKHAPDPRLAFGHGKQLLPPIPELLSPDRHHRRSRFPAAYYDPLSFDADENLGEDAEDEEERPTFTWEDENTLVTDLLHDGHGQESEDDKLTSLADSIQVSLSSKSKVLLGDIADNFVPAVNLVKGAHQVLNDQVDSAFIVGVLEFADVCKKTEAVAIAGHTELNKAYRDSQMRIKEFLKQLKEAYARRDQLWVDFAKALDETINPAIDQFKNLSPNMERIITGTLEKQSKQIGKDSDGKEKYLKLLSKFS